MPEHIRDVFQGLIGDRLFSSGGATRLNQFCGVDVGSAQKLKHSAHKPYKRAWVASIGAPGRHPSRRFVVSTAEIRTQHELRTVGGPSSARARFDQYWFEPRAGALAFGTFPTRFPLGTPVAQTVEQRQGFPATNGIAKVAHSRGTSGVSSVLEHSARGQRKRLKGGNGGFQPSRLAVKRVSHAAGQRRYRCAVLARLRISGID